MNTQDLIIGAGASGIMAAISAGRQGNSVIICERMAVIGKKLLASGSGRCNLLNEKLGPSFYSENAQELVKGVFSGFGKDKILGFFAELGLQVYNQDGRIFPVTNQSSSVLAVLEKELSKYDIKIIHSFAAKEIVHTSNGFVLTGSDSRQISSKKLIIAAGGQSYPSLGSDGSGYALAAKLGHTINLPVPACVPLIVKDPFCWHLQGQKIQAKVFFEGKEPEAVCGELLFTKYGLSGTVILDISRQVSRLINRDNIKEVSLFADMAPFISHKELAAVIAKRLNDKFKPEELLIGILPNKLCLALKDLVVKNDPGLIASEIKKKEFKVSGTRGWDEAEFSDGGVAPGEIKNGSLESKIVKNLYFCGEIVDVGGQRGGYNLAWAWASGFVAGKGL
jgi:predicted Rossmann fold flavoprotein